MKKVVLSILCFAALSLSAKVMDFQNFERDGRPVLIPEVQKYESSDGVCKLPAKFTVAVPVGEELILEQLARELKAFDIAVEAAAEKDACIRFVLTESDVPESKQGYTLAVTPQGVTVCSRTKQGVFYGAQTLRNLIRNAAKPELKCCRITDWPDFEYRSYTMVLSTDVESFKRTIDAISALKLNMINLSLAEQFPYRNNPLTRRKKAFDAATLRELVAYCHRRHIEIIPAVKLLSHTKWMTFHPNWDRMKEGTPGRLWDSASCPLNEECRELVRMTLEEHIELFKPSILYVGMDEIYYCPFRQCPRCKAMSTEALLTDYLNFVKGILDKHGVRMSVSQDSFLNNPMWGYGDFMRSLLPKNAFVSWWNYDNNPPEDKLAPFKGFQIIGTALSGRPLNIYNMARLVKKYGGSGCGLTYWVYTRNGMLGKPEHNTPDSYGGVVTGADYLWKFRETPYPYLGYDGTFEMMRIMFPELVTRPRRGGTAQPIHLGKLVNAELSGSGVFPRFASDAAADELKAALAKLPENFELLTSPGGKYYALRVNGSAKGGRRAIQIPCGGCKAERFSFLLTASRPRNGGDYSSVKIFKYEQAARLIINYTDGKQLVQKLRYRREITDWNRPFGGFDMRFAVRGVDADDNYYSFGIYDLRNPHPEKAVKSITFVSAMLDGISPALLAVSAWGADKPFPKVKFDPAAVAGRPGVRNDPPPKIRVVQDFSNGMGETVILTSKKLEGLVKSEIVDDPTSPGKGKVLKITVQPCSERGEGKDHAMLRVDVYMPYTVPKGTISLGLDHRIVGDPRDYNRSWEYLFDGPPGKRSSQMFYFRSTAEWKRDLRRRMSSVNGVKKVMKKIENTRFRMISYFFNSITVPTEIYIGNICDTDQNVSFVRPWKAVSEKKE